MTLAIELRSAHHISFEFAYASDSLSSVDLLATPMHATHATKTLLVRRNDPRRSPPKAIAGQSVAFRVVFT